MKIEKRPAIKKGIPLLLFGLFAFLLYIHLFVGFADVLNIFLLANPLYFSLASIAFLLNMTFYSLAWWRLLRVLSVKTNFKKPFMFIWVGTFVDILIPAEAISGEVSRAYLMYKDTNENAGKIVASVVGHRILSMATTLGGMIGASAFFLLRYEPPQLVVGSILVVIAGTALSLFLLLYLSIKEKAAVKLVDWVVNLIKRIFKGRVKGTRLTSRARKMLKEFHGGIEILGGYPKKLFLPIAFTVAAWLFDTLIAFFVFSSLYVDAPFSVIIIVYSIIAAVQTIPVGIPGEIGIVEIIMTSLYRLLLPGVLPSKIAAATLLIRALTLWAKLLISGVVVQWVGIKILKESP
jgi:hypothetical protein